MSAATLARWTDEEHEILVKLTNDQIELESQDHTQEISWAAHWRQVSSQLQDHGYSRTNTACQSYWKRVVDTQKANEEAAGPRWDDSEHQILLGMTEDQLALEKVDPSAVVPWPRHWKAVSQRLEEEGYHRSPNACSAYWLKVGYDFSVDYDPRPESPKLSKTDDRRAKPDVPEEVILDESASVASAGLRDHNPQPEQILEPKRTLLSNVTSVCTPAATPVPSEVDISEDEYQPRQREASKSKMSQAPAKPESPPPQKSKTRSFRFSAEQRALLENEAAANGAYPDSGKRAELALKLDVEEKTIRNWFVHRRSQKGLNPLPSNPSTPASNINDESFASDDANSASGLKRRPFTLACKESNLSIGEGTMEIQVRSPKRLRMEDEYGQNTTEARKSSNPHISLYRTVSQENGHTEPRPPINTPKSSDTSRNSSLTISTTERDSATTSTSTDTYENSYLFNSAIHRRTVLAADSALQLLKQPDYQGHRSEPEAQEPVIKKSPSLPTPTPGAEWNPINSAKGRDSLPTSLSSKTPTPTPEARNLQSNPAAQFQHIISTASRPVATPRAASPKPQSESSVGGNEKALFSRKVYSFQAEIDNLNRDKAARLERIEHIDRRIFEIDNEKRGLQDEKDRAIKEAVRVIEEQYKSKHEHMRVQRDSLYHTKEMELDFVRKNNREVLKKSTAVEHLQALVDMYDEDED